MPCTVPRWAAGSKKTESTLVLDEFLRAKRFSSVLGGNGAAVRMPGSALRGDDPQANREGISHSIWPEDRAPIAGSLGKTISRETTLRHRKEPGIGWKIDSFAESGRAEFPAR